MVKRTTPERRNQHHHHYESKKRKFSRLVLLLTAKKYGLWVILNLYFTSLLGAGIGAMDDIWTEFQRYQSCQERYITNVAGTVTENYNEAAHSLARSTIGKAQCLVSAFDLCKGAAGAARGVAGLAGDAASSLSNTFGGRRLTAGCTPDSFIRPVFGWAAPGSIKFPEVNMTINSNTQEVVKQIKDDISILEDMARWTRYAGWILAGLSVFLIVLTALYYTVRGKPWKPSRSSYALHLVTFVRVVGTYAIALFVVFLQAYSTDKFCNVSIQSINMDTPDCNINEDCDFDCVIEPRFFPNTCEKCDIKLHWWWAEPLALPNVLFVVYLVFHCAVLVFEFVEARVEKKGLLSKGAHKRVRSRVNRNDRRPKGQKGEIDSDIIDIKDSSENVVDGHADVEMGEFSDEQQPQTRYEGAIYTYPEKIYTGGLQ